MHRRKQESFVPMRPIPGFKKGVETIPCHCLVLTPDFTIVGASNVFLENTMTLRGDIVGRNIFDVFPPNPLNAMSNGAHDLRASFQRVLGTRHIDMIPMIRYDIPRPRSKLGFAERYWQPVNFPIMDKRGNVTHIIHNSEDVTSRVAVKKNRRHPIASQH